MMKYTRVDVPYKIEDGALGKVRLVVDGQDPETPWIRHFEGEENSVLVNHAINFYPFNSWGAMLNVKSGGTLDVKEMRESYTIPLHREAFDAYLEEGIIDAEGNYILKEEENAED